MHSINRYPFQANVICSYIWNKNFNTMKNIWCSKLEDGSRRKITTGMKYSQLCLGQAKPELGISQNENLKYKLVSYVSVLHINMKRVYISFLLVSECHSKNFIYKAIPSFFFRPCLKASAHRGMCSIILQHLLPFRQKCRFAGIYFVVSGRKGSQRK